MLVVEVDVVDGEAPQRRVAGCVDIVGPAVDPASARVVRIADDPELGRQHDLVAAVGDRFADEPFIGERPVDVGRVEQVDAELQRVLDRRDRLALVQASVKLRHPHATQPLGRHDEPL